MTISKVWEKGIIFGGRTYPFIRPPIIANGEMGGFLIRLLWKYLQSVIF